MRKEWSIWRARRRGYIIKWRGVWAASGSSPFVPVLALPHACACDPYNQRSSVAVAPWWCVPGHIASKGICINTACLHALPYVTAYRSKPYPTSSHYHHPYCPIYRTPLFWTVLFLGHFFQGFFKITQNHPKNHSKTPPKTAIFEPSIFACCLIQIILIDTQNDRKCS